ncbi:MAG: NADH-quinone oxidoreductase subunit N [bacterium]|nr:NADH-quinone oxidoreductase subunit N [bacterium]
MAPEFILAITVMAVLVVDLLPVRKFWTAVVAMLGLFATFVPILTLGLCESLEFCEYTGVREMFGGSYAIDTFSLVLKGLFIGSAFVALLLSVGYIESGRFWQGEFYFLMLASVLGAVVMASSRDLVTMFVGLELVTGPTFLMAGWRKGDPRSNEAALKYFIIGVLSAAVLLFGMSLVYGVTGELTFTGIRAESIGILDSDFSGLFIVGVLFTLLGFAFKVAAVPFHFWTPDTYEGAPTPVTAYLSVVSKTAGFVGLLSICYLAFAEVATLWGAGLWILAALSMTVGNLIALRQQNVVRLLGYSSIAQGGFILVPFGAAIAANATGVDLEEAFFATVTYLLIYAFMNLGAFATVIAVGNRLRSAEITDWAGLFSYAPGLAALIAVFFFSLAGIPPLAGWFAKFVMFRSVLAVGNTWATALAVVAVVNSVIALYYYSKVVISVFMHKVPDGVPVAELKEHKTAPALQFALILTAIGVIVLGIFPNLIAEIGEATKTFASGF